MENGIVIPAFNPDERIVELVKELKANGFKNIIVINDGSKDECKKYFAEIEENGVRVIKHEVNLGKGKGLKDGIKEFSKDSNIGGVITMDCDGQHLISDVVKVSEVLQKEGEFTIGKRNLFHNKTTPFTSKFGNAFSSLYLKIVTGVYLEDTQNGLRGIPRKHFDLAMKTEGDRFEFEMNLLKSLCEKKVPIIPVEIETVYENRIRTFRFVKDSYIIYKDFFRNIISSTISALIDIILFMILKNIILIFWANTISRVVSAFADFFINKNWVFSKKKESKNKVIFIKYVILFIVQTIISSTVMELLSKIFEHVLILKILVNIIMYVVNYFIKLKFIFV